MGTCVFKAADVKRCVKHALQATKFRMHFSAEPPGPALLFVHDQGVYLMSNGLPIDNTAPPEEEERSYVVYAAGCDPHINADWWDVSRDLVGGDDFGEVIKINEETLKQCDEFEELRVELTHESISVYFITPKKTRKAVKA